MKEKEKDGTYRITKQRQKILELLTNTKEHPTADQVYKKLKGKFPRLSLGTVYRNLRILKEQGQIWELDFGTGLSHFDAVVHSHYHFICKNCNKIYDIRIPAIKELDERVRTMTGFRIYSHRLEFFGLCDICNQRQSIN
ncbi:MAG: hypothetical protein AUJ74_03965 [Candidatus Omnitrophica bacterium CG1_02_44_16]|nr:MAG: hypothetical protein AUJ74_03965 [Candidatus Omnitrophica bacterium CG1_02_44_16]